MGTRDSSRRTPPSLTRRRAMAALAAAGGYALAAEPVLAQAIRTDSQGLYRPTYNAEAAKDGWARCLGWFQTYLKG